MSPGPTFPGLTEPRPTQLLVAFLCWKAAWAGLEYKPRDSVAILNFVTLTAVLTEATFLIASYLQFYAGQTELFKCIINSCTTLLIFVSMLWNVLTFFSVQFATPSQEIIFKIKVNAQGSRGSNYINLLWICQPKRTQSQNTWSVIHYAGQNSLLSFIRVSKLSRSPRSKHHWTHASLVLHLWTGLYGGCKLFIFENIVQGVFALHLHQSSPNMIWPPCKAALYEAAIL